MYMDRDFLFKLTNGIYQVTELFPKEEPLRFKIRERALEIFTDLILASPNPGIIRLEDMAPKINNNIEIMMGFFDLAESQNWTDARNFSVLRREYDKVRQSLQVSENCSPTVDGEPFSDNLTPRQKKIVEFLSGNGGAPVRDILKSLDEGISKRTLRRELGGLVKEGRIERVGRCNQIYYKTYPLS